MIRWRNLSFSVLAMTFCAGPAVAEHTAVLVARADTAITSIDPLDLRKVFLGLPVRTADNVTIRAAINRSDPKLYEIFLQDVMAMSNRAYDHRLLTLTLQSGRRRPETYVNIKELVQAIAGDASLVTFMWLEDIDESGGLKTLRVLWKK